VPQDEKKLRLFALFGGILLLNSCQLFQPNYEEQHNARCKEMKSQIMFNGASTNPGQAFEEKSEGPRLSQAYHDECT